MPPLHLESETIGSCISSHPVIFSDNCKYGFCVAGSDVRVLSVKTGETINTLTGHENLVTRLITHPKNGLQLLSCSLDGTVRIWDTEDGTCLRKIDVGTPVLDMVVSSYQEYSCFVLISRDGKYSLEELNLRNTSTLNSNEEKRKIAIQFSKKPSVGVVYGGGRFLATAVGMKLLVLDLKSRKLQHYIHSDKITAICFGSKPVVAIGDARGCITLCHGIDANDGVLSQNILVEKLGHWHAHAVRCMAFSIDGSYIYSGGEEAVLVIWQVESEDKTFIPRQGGTIRSIGVSKNGSHVMLSLGDNSVRLLSVVHLSTEWHLRGFNPSYVSSEFVKSARQVMRAAKVYAFDPCTKALVVPHSGGAGLLQWFDFQKNRHVSSLQLSERNRISKMNKSQPPSITIDTICFSHDGQWLATVSRMNGVIIDEMSSGGTLRFWQRRNCVSNANPEWVLNSLLDQPHDYARITAAKFHPSKNLLATTASDGSFRVWTCNNRIRVAKPAQCTFSKLNFSPTLCFVVNFVPNDFLLETNIFSQYMDGI